MLDFFAGSGSLAHAAYEIDAKAQRKLRTISVQLPELIEKDNKDTKEAYELCEALGKPANICTITKERLKRAIAAIQESYPNSKIDSGFKVFTLSSSNIQTWKPDRNDIEQSLLDHSEHLIGKRSELDILYELLLKRGVDLAVPIEKRSIADKEVHSIGFGVLFACLSNSISRADVDSLAKGVVDWHKELEPETDTHVFFRDSAFEDDIAKTNMAAILEQNGITHVRSL